MYCSKCGATVAEGAAFCGSCGQSTGAALAAQTQAGVLTPPPAPPVPQAAATGVLYAGFWLRVVAAIIDGLIIGIPFGAICVLVFASAIPELTRMQGEPPMMIVATILPRLLIVGLIYLAGTWLYWAGMESSEWQATLGKKALGLYVTDMDGKRTTFARTSGRFWAGRGIGIIPYLGGLYFLISCIMAGFTEKKQALHDMIANCLVLRKA